MSKALRGVPLVMQRMNANTSLLITRSLPISSSGEEPDEEEEDEDDGKDKEDEDEDEDEENDGYSE
jgi:hypothetical protein